MEFFHGGFKTLDFGFVVGLSLNGFGRSGNACFLCFFEKWQHLDLKQGPNGRFWMKMAARDGIEPPTNWLTASCSTSELPRNSHRTPAPHLGPASFSFFLLFLEMLKS